MTNIHFGTESIIDFEYFKEHDDQPDVSELSANDYLPRWNLMATDRLIAEEQKARKDGYEWAADEMAEELDLRRACAEDSRVAQGLGRQ